MNMSNTLNRRYEAAEAGYSEGLDATALAERMIDAADAAVDREAARTKVDAVCEEYSVAFEDYEDYTMFVNRVADAAVDAALGGQSNGR